MMARFQILSVDEPTGNYVPLVQFSKRFLKSATDQIEKSVPAVEVPDVLAMLGLVES